MPANAETSISSVDRGRWKLVTSASTMRKRNPGVMKRSVSPAPARSAPVPSADSSARRLVVPTATTRRRCGARGVHGGRGRRADVEPLAVHPVFGQVAGAHRLERAGADVQRDRRQFDAAGAQAVEQLAREVQAGGRRRDGAAARRVHGLVALRVLGGVGVRDVRRQRHVADGAPSRRSTSSSKRSRKNSSRRPSTVARASSNRNTAPGCGLWLVRTMASASVGSSTRSISASTRPPVGLRRAAAP